ncbi:hypothetical protein S7711_07705 [Stachybotrys chartarum IBT 7711]|uniref:Uncharacterized protein n=1 Tax=Stachybotrys chartarum (strain CBS 109288 / IBT 7711) TaxID=1280523 RepID=A0A084B7X9_STACB|nr:hypothetical protein S7711_07705 [Stachybotrys chartarum IBT 7711]KFA56558.1 hypothetical protein S40293_01127 [Stachybotrys chartarum IBT 40293]KFA72633.1 hypothetical protein S40288_03397 [Stachybotrys chartarum IBT 40288]
MRFNLYACLLLPQLGSLVTAQTPGSTEAAPTSDSSPIAPTSSGNGGGATPTTSGGGGGSSSTGSLGPPDVHLKVPELSVGRIELDVDNLRADINLNADIARLVQLNAGIQLGIERVNITIVDVEAELELVVRLGHLVEIVNRTLASLDLNPALVNLLDSVGDIVEGVIGAVDGLLGSITQGDTTLNFLIDNLGNIVQEVTTGGDSPVSTIIGNYRQNMTYTGQETNLANGLLQRTYEYAELGALVNIVFNSAGQIVQAQVARGGGSEEGEDDEDDDVPESSAPAASTPAAATATLT